MHAVILAGGYGTRLRSVWQGPKCLVPVAGRPILSWILSQLELWGVERAILALAHKADEVRAWVWQTRGMRRIQVDSFEETTPSGTQNAVRIAARRSSADVIMALNGDTYVHMDPTRLVDEHRGRGAKVTAFYDRNTKRHSGVICVDWLTAVRLVPDGDTLLSSARRVTLPLPFVDVGTPAGLADAHGFVRTVAMVGAS